MKRILSKPLNGCVSTWTTLGADPWGCRESGLDQETAVKQSQTSVQTEWSTEDQVESLTLQWEAAGLEINGFISGKCTSSVSDSDAVIWPALNKALLRLCCSLHLFSNTRKANYVSMRSWNIFNYYGLWGYSSFISEWWWWRWWR